MSPQPATITSLHAEPALATTLLTWDPLGFEPLIDHFRIYAVRGESAPGVPEETDLLAQDRLPPHRPQRPRPGPGYTWTYTHARRLRRRGAQCPRDTGHRDLAALGHRHRA